MRSLIIFLNIFDTSLHVGYGAGIGEISVPNVNPFLIDKEDKVIASDYNGNVKDDEALFNYLYRYI
jgi:hypothetical protein